MTDDAPDEHEPENHDDEPALGTMLGIEDGDVVHKNKGVGVGFVGLLLPACSEGLSELLALRFFNTQTRRNNCATRCKPSLMP